METERPERHSTPFGGSPARQQYEESVKAICRWVQVFSEHFQREVSDLATMAYIEGLKDLRPDQIQFCCEKTLREVDRMPTVAHIRQRFYGEPQTERPEYLDQPPASEEEREAALEYSNKLKETLAHLDDEERRPLPKFTPVTSPAFMAFHEAYVQWLNDEELKDEMLRKAGQTPLPRSEEERLAIFYNLPLSERNRLRRKAEWTKVSIKST